MDITRLWEEPLVSWAAIAWYLAVPEDTAREYRDRWGMPVKQDANGQVWTTVVAIENWIFRVDRLQREKKPK